MESDAQRLIPTISRVWETKLVELVYDAPSRKTALLVSQDGEWTVEQEVELGTGERLVPYSPNNNLIRHECVLLPSEPADYGGRDTLVDDIRAYLHRYVDLSPVFEDIAAHYILLSWVHDAFNELPYLRFKGDYGSGKTRALIALGSIAYRGFFASGASTVSPIFHTLDSFGGTLVLDEGDLRFSDKTADLVKILNNGTVKGLPVLRTMQNRMKEFNPAAFSVFGPKIVAMRGRFRDLALESRFLTEEMGQAPLRPDIPIQLPEGLRAEALALRNRLLSFRLVNRFAVKTDPARLVAGLDPRLNQTAISLLSVMDDPASRSGVAGLLSQQQAMLATRKGEALETRMQDGLRDAFAASAQPFVSLRDLADRINAAGKGEFVSPRQVGQSVREWGIPLHKSNGTIGISRRAFETRVTNRAGGLTRPGSMNLSPRGDIAR